MKNHSVISIVCLFAIILFNSCYQEIDLSEYKKEPILVLNSVATDQMPVMANITHSWFYSDKENHTPVTNAKVSLFVNNHREEEMFWNEKMYYSRYIPKENDRIKIMAETPEGVLQAEDRIPTITTIDEVSVSFQRSNWSINGSFIGTDMIYKITFQDDPDIENYYFIRFEDEYGNIEAGGQELGSLEYSTDPVFVGEKSELENIGTEEGLWGQGGRTFSDQLINGKRYTLTVREKRLAPRYDNSPVIRNVILYSLSESYYKYLTALQNRYDETIIKNLTELGLTEPRRIYGNVEVGAGIFGTFRRTHYQISFELPTWD